MTDRERVAEIIMAGCEAGMAPVAVADQVLALVQSPARSKAHTHPTRSRILELLAAGPASPVRLADQIPEQLGNVSYHVRQLAKLGLIELAGTRPVRGAVEHTYRIAVEG